MMMIKRFVSILSFLCIAVVVRAQHTDAGLWISAGADFNLPKGFSAEVQETAKYDATVDLLYQLNTDISLDYKINKHFKATANYRFSSRLNEGISAPNEGVQRVSFAITGRKGFGDLDLSLRSRYQYDFHQSGINTSAWRNKLTAKYKINKKISPFAGGEIFYSFSNVINQFDDMRLEAGFDYTLNKKNTLSFYYLFDYPFHINDPLTMHIAGIDYIYKF